MSEGQALRAYFQLARPANILTAMADILLGYAASGSVISFSLQSVQLEHLPALGWLLLATVGLYGGGVVLNDVFDVELDAQERPERPLPSGRVSIRGALLLGISLLVMGITAAAQVSAWSGLLAGGIAFLAVLYDAYGKHHHGLGPLNMGLCRGGNVLLGSSVLAFYAELLWIFFIPIIYISAITMVSRGEVHGGEKMVLGWGAVLYGIVIGMAGWLGLQSTTPLAVFVPALAVFAVLIGFPLFKAIQQPSPAYIGQAVKMGVISLILLDACLAITFAGGLFGLLIAALLPFSLFLARYFSVT